MKSLRLFLENSSQITLDTVIKDWWKLKHPDSPIINEFRDDVTFDDILRNIQRDKKFNGADGIFSALDIYDTRVANEIIDELARLTQVSRSKIYNWWKN